MQRRHKTHFDAGAVMVEMVLVLPLLLLAIFGTIYICMLCMDKLQLEYATHYAAANTDSDYYKNIVPDASRLGTDDEENEFTLYEKRFAEVSVGLRVVALEYKSPLPGYLSPFLQDADGNRMYEADATLPMASVSFAPVVSNRNIPSLIQWAKSPPWWLALYYPPVLLLPVIIDQL